MDRYATLSGSHTNRSPHQRRQLTDSVHLAMLRFYLEREEDVFFEAYADSGLSHNQIQELIDKYKKGSPVPEPIRTYLESYHPCARDGCENNIPKRGASRDKDERLFCCADCMAIANNIDLATIKYAPPPVTTHTKAPLATPTTKLPQEPTTPAHGTTAIPKSPPKPPATTTMGNDKNPSLTISGQKVDVPDDHSLWPQETGAIGYVPLSALVLDRENPRIWYDEATLPELLSGLQNSGQVEPFAVTIEVDADGTFTGHYRLVSGNRRTRAMRLASNQEQLVAEVVVRCFTSEHDRRLAALASNTTEALCDRDWATTLRQLMDEGNYKNPSQLARAIGKPPGFVAQMLDIGGLPETVLELMDPERPRKEQLTREPALTLARADLTPGNKSSLAMRLLEHVGSRHKKPTAPQQVTWLQNKIKEMGSDTGPRRRRAARTIVQGLAQIVSVLANRRGLLGDRPGDLPFTEMVEALGGALPARELLEQARQAHMRFGEVLDGLGKCGLQEAIDQLALCPDGHILCTFYGRDTKIRRSVYVPREEYLKIRAEGRLAWQRWGQERPAAEPTDAELRTFLPQ